MNHQRERIVVLALIAALAAGPAWARGGHGGWHGGGHHDGHWGAAIGLLIGVPLLLGALREPDVVYRERPVYIEREPRAAPAYRYYCPTSRRYYPAVPSCDRDWLRVVPDDGAPY